MLITRKAAWQILVLHLCMKIHLQSIERSVLVDLTLWYLDSKNNTKKTVFAPPCSRGASGKQGQKELPGRSILRASAQQIPVCAPTLSPSVLWLEPVRLLWLHEASVTVIKWPTHIHLTASSPQQGLYVKLETKENSKRDKILLTRYLV